MNYKDFEQHISKTILSRGKDYFDNGAVEDRSKEDGHWLANVHGSELYDVVVKGIRSIKGWDCDCPYDRGPICKHVVAVLYAVQVENNKTKTPASKKAKSQVNEIFKNAKPEDLLAFFKKNLRHNKSLKHKLLAEFLHLLDADDKDRYNKIIENLIKGLGRRYGYIDYREGKRLLNSFNQLLSQAETAIQQKNYLDAMDICTAVLSKVPNLLLSIDDSNGSLQDICHYALEILESLLKTSSPPNFKDQVFDFFLRSFEKAESGFGFKNNFLNVLLDNNWEDDKLKLIQIAVKNIFDNLQGYDIEYSQEYYMTTLINIAQQLDNENEVENLIQLYLHFPHVRQIKLEMLLEKEDYKAAKQLMLAGIKVAEQKNHSGTITQWKNVLIKISRLETDIEEERKLLREAFFQNYHRMEYLLQLKDTFDLTEWFEEREKIISQILGKDKIPNRNNSQTLAQIFVEERLWERLLDLFHAKKVSMYLIDNYGFHLHKEYPQEMLTLYKPLVIHEARQANSRSHYRGVANKLLGLLKIKGGREVVIELLQKFRTEYIKRPAMMDELRNVL